MKNGNKRKLQDQISGLEKEITEFLGSLPANDNIGDILCGIGFVEGLEAANDNGNKIDQREFGIDFTISSAHEEINLNVSHRGAEVDGIRELDFSDNRAGQRGFLAEEYVD